MGLHVRLCVSIVKSGSGRRLRLTGIGERGPSQRDGLHAIHWQRRRLRLIGEHVVTRFEQ